MKHKLLLFVFIITSPIAHSQTEKKITAIVVCSDFALQGIDVVNLNSKKITITTATGSFSIMAKVGDQLMFISKYYEYKTITIKEVNFQNSNFRISLLKKPEELDEVVVVKMPTIKWSKDKAYEQGKIHDWAIEKAAKHPKPIGVYDGTIENGMTKIIKLFQGKQEISQIDFKTLVNSNLDSDFFKNTLALKSEEVELFLEYCDADPNSKHVLDNPNPLKIMDVLMAKIEEFKKMPKN